MSTAIAEPTMRPMVNLLLIGTGGFFGAIGGSRHRFIRAWEDGGSAVCEGEVTYTRHDGSTLTVPFVNVFYLQGDKVRRYLILIDNSALFG